MSTSDSFEELRAAAETARTITATAFELDGEAGGDLWSVDVPNEIADFMGLANPVAVLHLLDRLAATEEALAEFQTESEDDTPTEDQ